MPFRIGRAAYALVPMVLACAACGGIFGKEYEYEEELYLDIDGAATLNLYASLASLAALHGVAVDAASDASPDPDRIRQMFSAPGVEVSSPSFFRRDGRRFVRLRVTVARVADLQAVAPLSWSTYRFDRTADTLVFHQTVGRSDARSIDEGAWTGSEIVAFRLHAPSKVLFENATSDVQRGNILAWEQPLSKRLAGSPLDLRVEMEAESILHSTLLLFGGAILAAAASFGVVIWWVVRKGRRLTAPAS
jgi:hypothetical protein